MGSLLTLGSSVIICVGTPHSLGKLIEWKLEPAVCRRHVQTPHSLGKLIEWKRLRSRVIRTNGTNFPLAGKTN